MSSTAGVANDCVQMDQGEPGATSRIVMRARCRQPAEAPQGASRLQKATGARRPSSRGSRPPAAGRSPRAPAPHRRGSGLVEGQGGGASRQRSDLRIRIAGRARDESLVEWPEINVLSASRPRGESRRGSMSGRAESVPGMPASLHRISTARALGACPRERFKPFRDAKPIGDCVASPRELDERCFGTHDFGRAAVRKPPDRYQRGLPASSHPHSSSSLRRSSSIRRASRVESTEAGVGPPETVLAPFYSWAACARSRWQPSRGSPATGT